MPERRSRAGGDAALVFLSRALAAVALLALTPFVVAQLGKPAYGVWIVVSAATGLAGLVDVGIGPAVSRVVAAAAARDDAAAIRSTVATALLASFALDLPLLAGGWLLAPVLAGLLDVPAALHDPARDALRLAFAAFALTTLAAVWEGVLVGHRRFRALLGMRVGYVLAFTAGAIATLRGGHGVVGLAASQVGGMALALALGALACRRLLRSPARARPSRASLRQLLRYGLPQQSSRFAYAGAMHYERLLIGIVCGAGVAAEYGAASTVAAALASLLAQSTVVLVPLLTRVHVRRPEALDDAFARALGAVSAIAAGALGALAASAGPLVAAWLGPGFGRTERLMQILAVGFAMWVVAHPGFALVQSLGRPALEARAAGVVVLVNAVATSVLVAVFGAHALALGTSAALTLGALAFWRVAAAALPRASGWRRSLAVPLLTAALLAAAISALNDLVVSTRSLARPEALALGAGEALLFAALYTSALVRAGAIALPASRALLRRAPAVDAEAA
ncbi:MAG: oligosaccharide flippase family protein [Actinobacteria bacterium]|nr:oligosaccharide flippase family protein [Actinomycetota bacterium]